MLVWGSQRFRWAPIGDTRLRWRVLTNIIAERAHAHIRIASYSRCAQRNATQHVRLANSLLCYYHSIFQGPASVCSLNHHTGEQPSCSWWLERTETSTTCKKRTFARESRCQIGGGVVASTHAPSDRKGTRAAAAAAPGSRACIGQPPKLALASTLALAAPFAPGGWVFQTRLAL